MDSLAAHLQSIERSLNQHLGINPSRPLADGAQVHQFVFSPTFYPSSTFVLDCSESGTEAFFDFYDRLGMGDDADCWQDIQSVDSVLMAGFLDAATVLEPWSLTNANTYSRDGILLGYRYQTAIGEARFCAFNPEWDQHARQIAWLERGFHLAIEVFRSTDALLYLEGLRKHFIH